MIDSFEEKPGFNDLKYSPMTISYVNTGNIAVDVHVNISSLHFYINSLYLHLLLNDMTGLHTFLEKLVERICLKIKAFPLW